MLQFLRIGGFIVESWRNSSTIDLTSTLPIQGTQVLWVGMRFFLCQKIEVTLIDVRRVLYGRVTITPLYICIYISWFMKFPVMRHGCEAVAWQWWSWNHVPVTRRAPFALKQAMPPPRRRVDFVGRRSWFSPAAAWRCCGQQQSAAERLLLRAACARRVAAWHRTRCRFGYFRCTAYGIQDYDTFYKSLGGGSIWGATVQWRKWSVWGVLWKVVGSLGSTAKPSASSSSSPTSRSAWSSIWSSAEARTW